MGEGATRHLGLDLGGTNLKWAIVERGPGTWRSLARDSVPTRQVPEPRDMPAAVTAQLGEVARVAIDAAGPVRSIGIGIPGLYDPATGRTRFLVNVPGPWAGHPVAGPGGCVPGAQRR